MCLPQIQAKTQLKFQTADFENKLEGFLLF